MPHLSHCLTFLTRTWPQLRQRPQPGQTARVAATAVLQPGHRTNGNSLMRQPVPPNDPIQAAATDTGSMEKRVIAAYGWFVGCVPRPPVPRRTTAARPIDPHPTTQRQRWQTFFAGRFARSRRREQPDDFGDAGRSFSEARTAVRKTNGPHIGKTQRRRFAIANGVERSRRQSASKLPFVVQVAVRMARTKRVAGIRRAARVGKEIGGGLCLVVPSANGVGSMCPVDTELTRTGRWW